jgi:Ribonuclease HII
VVGCAERIAVRVIPHSEIDRNGLHVSNLAGLRAMLHALAPPAEACLVDGFRLGAAAPEHTAVVDGDEKSAAIAAASIVAKVTRDRLMHRLDAPVPRPTGSHSTSATSRRSFRSRPCNSAPPPCTG